MIAMVAVARTSIRGAVVAGLTALTVGVFFPGSLWADDCEGACHEAFGECKECEGEWNGEYSHCSGTQCYYVCGSDCVIEPD